MPYTAPAVTFSGTQYINIPSLSCTDNNVFSMFFAFKRATINGHVNTLFKSAGSTYTGATLYGTTGSLDTILYNATDTAGLYFGINPYLMPLDSYWHSVLVSVDCSGATAVYDVYIGRTQITPDYIGTDTGPATFPFNGAQFRLGQDGSGNPFYGSLSNVWIAPGVSLLSGGAIPSATLDLFMNADGTPNDPSGYPAGGVVIFSGDMSGFATNQGSGGAATLTGTLADADFGPSDTPTGYNFEYFSEWDQTAQWADPNSSLIYILRGLSTASPPWALSTLNRTSGATVTTQTYTTGTFPSSTNLWFLTGGYSDSTYIYGTDSITNGAADFDVNYRRFNKSALTLNTTYARASETFNWAGRPMAISPDGSLIAQFGKTATSPPTNTWKVRILKTSDGTVVDTDIETVIGTGHLTNEQDNPMVWDASNNLWLGIQAGTVYKLAVNPTTLAITLGATYASLTGGDTVANITNFQPSGDLLIWYINTGTGAAAVIRWDPDTETTIAGPFSWTTENSVDVSDPNRCNLQNTTNYLSIVSDGANLDDFSVISILDGTETLTAASNWAVTNTLNYGYYNAGSSPSFIAQRTGGSGFGMALFLAPSSGVSTGSGYAIIIGPKPTPYR